MSTSRCSARASSERRSSSLARVVRHHRLELRRCGSAEMKPSLSRPRLASQVAALQRERALRLGDLRARRRRSPAATRSRCAAHQRRSRSPANRAAPGTAPVSFGSASPTRASCLAPRASSSPGKASVVGERLLGLAAARAPRARPRRGSAGGCGRRPRRTSPSISTGSPAFTRWPSRTSTSRTMPPSRCCTGRRLRSTLTKAGRHHRHRQRREAPSRRRSAAIAPSDDPAAGAHQAPRVLLAAARRGRDR